MKKESDRRAANPAPAGTYKASTTRPALPIKTPNSGYTAASMSGTHGALLSWTGTASSGGQSTLSTPAETAGEHVRAAPLILV